MAAQDACVTTEEAMRVEVRVTLREIIEIIPTEIVAHLTRAGPFAACRGSSVDAPWLR